MADLELACTNCGDISSDLFCEVCDSDWNENTAACQGTIHYSMGDEPRTITIPSGQIVYGDCPVKNKTFAEEEIDNA